MAVAATSEDASHRPVSQDLTILYDAPWRRKGQPAKDEPLSARPWRNFTWNDSNGEEKSATQLPVAQGASPRLNESRTITRPPGCLNPAASKKVMTLGEFRHMQDRPNTEPSEVRSSASPGRQKTPRIGAHEPTENRGAPHRLAPLTAGGAPGAQQATAFPPVPRVREAVSSEVESAIAKLSGPSAVWNPEVFNVARAEATQIGSWSKLNELNACVKSCTEYALRRQRYFLPADSDRASSRHREVDLRAVSSPAKVHWFGQDNAAHSSAKEAPVGKMIPPPVLMADCSVLDVAVALSNSLGKAVPIFVLAEQLGFTSSGTLDLDRSAAVSPACLPLRTDFRRFTDTISNPTHTSEPTLKAHMCAATDPYVLHCPGVTVFRGSRETGYPFLKEPAKVDVILTAMTQMRPPITLSNGPQGRKVEWYHNEADLRAVNQRLALAAQVALQESQKTDAAVKPILIMSMPGCCGGGRHPRDAISNALKHWRRKFCEHFHSVFVCTGGQTSNDPSSTAQMDNAVNKQVYMVLDDPSLSSSLLPWHWDARVFGLCVSLSRLSCINDVLHPELALPSGDGEEEGTNGKASSRAESPLDLEELPEEPSIAGMEVSRFARGAASEPIQQLRRRSLPAGVGNDARRPSVGGPRASLTNLVMGAFDKSFFGVNDLIGDAVNAVKVSEAVRKDLAPMCRNKCGRRAAGGFPTCCETCDITKGQRHGPTCEQIARSQPEAPEQSSVHRNSAATQAAMNLKEKLAQDHAKTEEWRSFRAGASKMTQKNMDFGGGGSRRGSPGPGTSSRGMRRWSVGAARTGEELQKREEARRMIMRKRSRSREKKPQEESEVVPRRGSLPPEEQESATKAAAAEAANAIFRRTSQAEAPASPRSVQSARVSEKRSSEKPMGRVPSNAQASLLKMKTGAGLFAHTIATAQREHANAQQMQQIDEKKRYGTRKKKQEAEELAQPQSARAPHSLREQLLKRKPRQKTMQTSSLPSDVVVGEIE
mmetsp:Transcript_75954/g.180617  ORF Transcript_75954/g.180617 Transcript_75954/m.180617 type:complete len:994 (-) Transcript_75954:49-3030(-)